MPLNDNEVLLGMLNDNDREEFDNSIEDEDLSIYPPPGVEIGTLKLRLDQGSGSFAQDGRLEVAEDRLMLDGETQLGGPASEDGQSEIGWGEYNGVGVGAAEAADRAATEIGLRARAAATGPNEIEAAGEIEAAVTPFDLFMLDDARMGAADRGYGSEIGAADRGYGSEIGSAAMYGPTEIGSAAMYGPTEIGGIDDVGAGYAPMEGQSEIGAAAAVVKVVETARDNRQPPPPMRAVDIDDAPSFNAGWDEDLTDTLLGAAAATGNPDPFPLTSQFMLRCGAGMSPRFVRVDSEESYKKFRADSSPELADLRERLEAHIVDPNAHGGEEISSDLSDDVEDLVHLGAEVEAAEEEKRLELWMPKHFDGFVEAWREGDSVGASMVLPDGRIATTLEPVSKSVAEMSRHAAEAGVPASTVVGVLSAMGCILGAGTALKEMAAAAPSLVQRADAAGTVVRIEPKTCPALCALAMLVMACRAGVVQACDEWQNLAALAPAPVKQAMLEAVQIAKAAA